MLRAKLLGSVCAVAISPGCARDGLRAQPADKRTYFTFSGPVEMPGVALPAGRYVFRIANPDTSRNVIQVLSGDGKKKFGLFSSHNSERATASDDAEVRFMEAGPEAPPAIGHGGIRASGRAMSSCIPNSRHGASRSGRDSLC